jgi:glycosyltransferase involved in cell wall biosynthesis
MRVLHLPYNIASIPSHTVKGLRQTGVEVYGLMLGNALVQSADGLKVIEPVPRRKVYRWVWRSFRWLYNYLKWVAWADVIHWYFTPVLPWGLDLKYIKALGKPGVVEWLGSDIRIPEIEFEDNPYYKAAFYSGYEYQSESLQRSRQVQKKFAEAGFASIVPVCMLRYVQTDICPRVYVVPQRILLSDYNTAYPDPAVTRPLIVHAPTAPIAKGTPAVLKAIEKLKIAYNFEFRLLHGMSRNEALQVVQRADIFLDQFVVGDHGMAALEAMAFGKPVVCYIKPSMIDKYPPDLPIINATQDNLPDVLEPLLRDGELRHEIGKRSRAYVEKYHDAIKLAYRLVDIYQEVIEDKRDCGC